MDQKEEKLFANFLHNLGGRRVYELQEALGTGAIDNFVRLARKANARTTLTKTCIDRHFNTVAEQTGDKFSTENAIRWVNYLPAPTDEVEYAILSEEVIRILKTQLGEVYDKWEPFLKDEYTTINCAILALLGAHHRYGPLGWTSPTPVGINPAMKEYLYELIFKATSEMLTRNEVLGFSFSSTLFMAKPWMYYKRCKTMSQQVAGRKITRLSMVHLCPNENMPKRLIIRPINDTSKPPSFFCRSCKERLGTSHKTFFKLNEMGERL